MLHIAKDIFAVKTFSKSLGTDLAELAYADQERGVAFTMCIPERICMANPWGFKKPILSTSSAMAIFDDLSTYSFMVKDRNCRTGVSVVLSAEMLRDVPVGEKVQVVSTVNKIGKTIGFCDVFMYDSKDNLIARGYHTKHLPMGLFYNVITHPMVADASMSIFENYYSKIQHTQFGKALAGFVLQGRNRTMTIPTFTGVGSVVDAFNIKAIKDISKIQNSKSPRHKKELVEDKVFELAVQPFMSNIRGFFHGGATAMSIERAITVDSEATKISGRVNRLEVHYLNGMKVTIAYFLLFLVVSLMIVATILFETF